MNDLEKYRSSNLVILEKDVGVDCIEWSCSHPSCDALYLDDCTNVK